jgi:hypothetical protein
MCTARERVSWHNSRGCQQSSSYPSLTIVLATFTLPAKAHGLYIEEANFGLNRFALWINAHGIKVHLTVPPLSVPLGVASGLKGG